jgi:hypothetical protein
MGEWVELSNGCMCCAVKSEFVQAIEALMLKKEKFDHILIETTGESFVHVPFFPERVPAYPGLSSQDLPTRARWPLLYGPMRTWRPACNWTAL